MTEQRYLQIEAKIIEVLKSIYDPEIPINIYDLGLIYKVEVNEENIVYITMTLTAPNCPMADALWNEIENNVSAIEEVKSTKINLVFDPPWDKSMLTDEARLELGLL